MSGMRVKKQAAKEPDPLSDMMGNLALAAGIGAGLVVAAPFVLNAIGFKEEVEKDSFADWLQTTFLGADQKPEKGSLFDVLHKTGASKDPSKMLEPIASWLEEQQVPEHIAAAIANAYLDKVDPYQRDTQLRMIRRWLTGIRATDPQLACAVDAILGKEVSFEDIVTASTVSAIRGATTRMLQAPKTNCSEDYRNATKTSSYAHQDVENSWNSSKGKSGFDQDRELMYDYGLGEYVDITNTVTDNYEAERNFRTMHSGTAFCPLSTTEDEEVRKSQQMGLQSTEKAKTKKKRNRKNKKASFIQIQENNTAGCLWQYNP